MAKEKVVVYGLTTEGYFMACQMAIKGADVYLVDESSPTAISLKPEVAKNCPNIDSLKEDEPLLSWYLLMLQFQKLNIFFLRLE